MKERALEILPLGDSALLVRLAAAKSEVAMVETVLANARALLNGKICGVVEVAPAYRTLGVFYDGAQCSFKNIASDIERVLANVDATFIAARVVEIPVVYGGDFGPDLESVAQHSKLSAEEVIARHAMAEYRVSCVGFTPGFPYLSGLPDELSIPRRSTPRRQVPAGSVAIGGSQTGVYPTASPGGWHVIGRTSLRLFDVQREPPALLQAGDRVRFRAVPRAELETLGE